MNVQREKLNILMISDRILPNPTANAIIIKNICEELINNGHKVTYISINQEDASDLKKSERFSIYNIKGTIYSKLLIRSKEGGLNNIQLLTLKVVKYARKLINLLFVYRFPDVEPFQSQQTFRLAKKLHERDKFDCIIGVFRPFTGVAAAILMKKVYPEIVCGAYYLDLLTSASKPSLIPSKLYNYICYKGELKAFRNLDFVFMPKSGEKIYNTSRYYSINNKIDYIDFPIFKNLENIEEKNNNDTLNIVYAGTLDLKYRNPEYAIKLLTEVGKKYKMIDFSIYGRSNCISLIKKYSSEKTMRIYVCGSVEHNRAVMAMLQADFLINISNKLENMVPSKIFELFSTGKPILNFVSNKNDITLQYFNKYPSVCTINEWDDYHDNINKITAFIDAEKGKQYDTTQIKQEFIENTPEFVTNLILKKIIKEIKSR